MRNDDVTQFHRGRCVPPDQSREQNDQLQSLLKYIGHFAGPYTCSSITTFCRSRPIRIR